MKSIFRFGCAVLSAALLIAGLCVSAFAADESDEDRNPVLYTGELSEDLIEDKAVKVSYGLDVIAANSGMAVAGISGEALNFSADRFACAMNLAKIDYITITKLPEAVCGSLYLGSVGVEEGQKISAQNLSQMTYEEAKSGVGKETSFKFTVNDSAYEIECSVFMLKELNYSPTVSLASYASLNLQTYRGIKATGVLSAYDPEGDELTYEITKYPENGYITLTDKNLGTYVYTPSDSYTGKDSFEYVARDKYGNYSASAKVSLDVSSPSTSAVYSDLEDSDIYNYAITMTEIGAMNGVLVGDNYYFEPDREVTRADFLVTTMKALGIKNIPDVEKTEFYDDDDISPEKKGYVALAYSMGYISGIKQDGEVYFKPDENIKLSEAAVIISNIIGYADAKVTPVFADEDEIPDWSSKAVYSIHALGILEASDGVCGVSDNITRGDMAKLLAKSVFVISN